MACFMMKVTGPQFSANFVRKKHRALNNVGNDRPRTFNENIEMIRRTPNVLNPPLSKTDVFLPYLLSRT